MAARNVITAILAAGLLAGVGCSSSDSPEWKPDRERTGYIPAYRKHAPQPVYNRLTWVRPPSVMPARNVTSAAPEILPVFHLDLKNASMDEAAQILAATARFSSYCSSTIADRKITINRLGTIDELAEEISSAAGITVQVDRESQTVRFLPKLAPQPEFFETKPEALTTGAIFGKESNLAGLSENSTRRADARQDNRVHASDAAAGVLSCTQGSFECGTSKVLNNEVSSDEHQSDN